MAVVCRSVAGLRSSPSSRSELLTQEFFGREVSIHSTCGDWVECVLADGYRGWMAAGALHDSDGYAATHVVRRRFARLGVEGGTGFLLPLGSRLDVRYGSGSGGSTPGREIGVTLPDGRAGSVSADSVMPVSELPLGLEDFPAIRAEVEGTPYLWGGKSTFGFDCSGLVQVVFELLGHDLPRDSKDQAQRGDPVEDLEQMRPYDLVFFGDEGGIDHVAFHLGGLSILHASGHVKVESLSEASPLFRKDLHSRIRFARRILHV